MNLKSASEIRLMAEGGKILKMTLDQVRKNIKPGISTWELDQIAEKFILNNGAVPAFKGYQNYPNSACISINHQLVHTIPSKNKIIKNGDIVSVDCGVFYKGYNTDSAFTVGVGEIDDLKNKLVVITKKSLDNAIDMIKPGIKFSEVQAVIQSTIESAGFSVIRDLAGHGIGKSVHEPPTIYNFAGRGPHLILQEGMTFCIEPMASAGSYQIATCKDGWTVESVDKSPTAHFEHTIAVTKDSNQVLTK